MRSDITSSHHWTRQWTLGTLPTDKPFPWHWPRRSPPLHQSLRPLASPRASRLHRQRGDYRRTGGAGKTQIRCQDDAPLPATDSGSLTEPRPSPTIRHNLQWLHQSLCAASSSRVSRLPERRWRRSKPAARIVRPGWSPQARRVLTIWRTHTNRYPGQHAALCNVWSEPHPRASANAISTGHNKGKSVSNLVPTWLIPRRLSVSKLDTTFDQFGHNFDPTFSRIVPTAADPPAAPIVMPAGQLATVTLAPNSLLGADFPQKPVNFPPFAAFFPACSYVCGQPQGQT
jgi:hypothetical protein